MITKLLIDAHYKEETRIAVVDENNELINFETEYTGKKFIKGNIYLAKVERVEPAIQAAFINYGDDKHGFLPLSEIQYEYYNKNIVKSAEDSNDPKNYKIQEVIHHGQVVLVQAIREKRGQKCAAFSTFLSLPGRYCVLLSKTNSSKLTGGISKKIDANDKNRLREIIDSLDVPEGLNVIIRTAGESRTKQEIKRDFEYLVRLWNEIKEKVITSNAPLLIHEEGNIIKRTIRDLYNKDTSGIIIQGANAYKDARTFMKLFTPSHCKKIELHDDNAEPIFSKFDVEEKINKIFDTSVSLPSGGSIVINTTEALTAIDVNSGKMKNEKNLDETAFKTNMEAAIEAARQIRLRDIAGLIVIDFIDMYDVASIQQVEKKFKECIRIDYSNVQIAKLSQFGLLEVSRQRMRQSISDINFVTCKHCCGTGKVLSNETIGMSIIRQIEHFINKTKPAAKAIIAEVADEIDLFILNDKRRLIMDIENESDVSIDIIRNKSLGATDCKIIIKEFREEEEVGGTAKIPTSVDFKASIAIANAVASEKNTEAPKKIFSLKEKFKNRREKAKENNKTPVEAADIKDEAKAAPEADNKKSDNKSHKKRPDNRGQKKESIVNENPVAPDFPPMAKISVTAGDKQGGKQESTTPNPQNKPTANKKFKNRPPKKQETLEAQVPATQTPQKADEKQIPNNKVPQPPKAPDQKSAEILEKQDVNNKAQQKTAESSKKTDATEKQDANNKLPRKPIPAKVAPLPPRNNNPATNNKTPAKSNYFEGLEDSYLEKNKNIWPDFDTLSSGAAEKTVEKRQFRDGKNKPNNKPMNENKKEKTPNQKEAAITETAPVKSGGESSNDSKKQGWIKKIFK